MGVYLPPDANVTSAINQLTTRVLAAETTYPDSVIIILGDFNHTNLNKVLPRYKQHVNCSTRNNKTGPLLHHLQGRLPGHHQGSVGWVRSRYSRIDSYIPSEVKNNKTDNQDIEKADWRLNDCFESLPWEHGLANV